LSQPGQQFSIAHVILPAASLLLGMQCLASLIALTDGQASLLAGLPELLDVALPGHRRSESVLILRRSRWPAYVVFSRVLHELLGRAATTGDLLAFLWSEELVQETVRVLMKQAGIDIAQRPSSDNSVASAGLGLS
jgi:hypothetical protein